MLGGKIWQDVEPLPAGERVAVEVGPDGYPLDLDHASDDHRRLEELQGSARGS